MSGSPDEWIEFEPEIKIVDLTQVKGDKTQEIWRGNIPKAEYKNVYIYVSDISGVLKETDEQVEIKLPSQKLHVSEPFEITANMDVLTSFTYDLTVIAAGNAQSGIKYILKPQIDESGTSITSGQGKEKGKGSDNIKDKGKNP